MPEQPIPMQPVESPILCPPYRELEQHPLDDRRSGIPDKWFNVGYGNKLYMPEALSEGIDFASPKH